MNEAAKSSSEIAASVGGVTQLATEAQAGSAKTEAAATELSQMSLALQRLVGQFHFEPELVAPANRPTPRVRAARV